MNNIEKQIINDHKRFHRHYQEILHRHSRLMFTINQSSAQQDMKEGFDYYLSFSQVNVAVRNRDYKYYDKYGDFTIRAKSINGGKTEIDKIREGCGDIYLYVWQNKEGSNIHTYLIVDLSQFRQSGLIFENRRLIPNIDGTKFVSYSIHELYRNNCILALNRFKK